jgi:hypothetical protein
MDFNMPYINGLNYGQQQYGALSSPNIGLPSGPTQSLPSGAPMSGGQQANMNQGGLPAMPPDVAANIAAYNPYSMRTGMGDMLQDKGISNYRSAQNQHGGGQYAGQNWVPWALQANSAGGYGGIGNQVGDLFINPMSQIQAGSQYSFGAKPSQIMASQYQRDPMTGNIIGMGAAQQVDNPLALQYQMGMGVAGHLATMKGMGLGSDEYLKNLSGLGNDYYGAVSKQFGQGQFDTSNFDPMAKNAFYNVYANQKAGTLPDNSQDIARQGTYYGMTGPLGSQPVRSPFENPWNKGGLTGTNTPSQGPLQPRANPFINTSPNPFMEPNRNRF